MHGNKLESLQNMWFLTVVVGGLEELGDVEYDG